MRGSHACRPDHAVLDLKIVARAPTAGNTWKGISQQINGYKFLLLSLTLLLNCLSSRNSHLGLSQTSRKSRGWRAMASASSAIAHDRPSSDFHSRSVFRDHGAAENLDTSKVPDASVTQLSTDPGDYLDHGLRRGLKGRHFVLIALGSIIGPGESSLRLQTFDWGTIDESFIGTFYGLGYALYLSGPLGLFIGFGVVGKESSMLISELHFLPDGRWGDASADRNYQCSYCSLDPYAMCRGSHDHVSGSWRLHRACQPLRRSGSEFLLIVAVLPYVEHLSGLRWALPISIHTRMFLTHHAL